MQKDEYFCGKDNDGRNLLEQLTSALADFTISLKATNLDIEIKNLLCERTDWTDWWEHKRSLNDSKFAWDMKWAEGLKSCEPRGGCAVILADMLKAKMQK